MSSNPTPYIGSKISLVSSSEIRYEGVLYNINTEEATIALQSVRCFGTEGRKMPEIPPSNEVYDFIIFSGQDIKDLTVLESGNSPAINDPAILSVNKPPPGGKDALEALKGAEKGLNLKGKAPDGKGKGYEGPKGYDGKDGKGYDGGYDGKGYGGKGYQNGKSYDNGRGYQSSGWGNPGKGYDYPLEAKGGYGKDKGKEKGKDMVKGKDAGKGKGDAMDGKGKDGKGKGDFKGDGKGKSDFKGQQGKKGDKGSPKGKDGKGKDGKGKDGKGKGKGEGKGKDGRGEGKGGRRRGGGGNGIVGELLPEENADTKRQCAEEFDFVSSAQKFDKVSDLDALKPLEGYNKGKSFFDSISCEATERSGEAGRQRSDRDKAREADVEAFGDANRRGKGQRKGRS